jgi:hypothetical protein
MNNLQWTPRQIGELTIGQAVCLGNRKPPRPGEIEE